MNKLKFTLDKSMLLVAGCNCSTDTLELDNKDASDTHEQDCRRSKPDRVTPQQIFEAWKEA